jgi:aconitate hydratase
MAADCEKEGYPKKLTATLIGSCTNSSYEDICRATDVAQQALDKGLKMKTTLWVSPGSDLIFETIKRDGQLEILEEVGATVLTNACGPCIGQWKREDIEEGERNSIVTSFNRNFRKRNDGNPETHAFIGSPEIVMAYGLAGRLDFDPLTDTLVNEMGEEVRLDAPAKADELPPAGFAASSGGYHAPPPDRSTVEIIVASDSERLALLEPFSPWNGENYEALPLLIKVKGKCTTDHISMAGPWLKYRGHLDNISNNMLIGGINAFTGETGKTKDQLSDETGKSVPDTARHYKAEGKRWVVVGDENYGEGSSREHAAMSPRHLGAAAIITRSFARIHETNLKKQGILPLTFADPADYEKVLEDDKISLRGLKELAPDKPITALLQHSDGSSDEISLNHTLTKEQISWFQQGSALNKIKTM